MVKEYRDMSAKEKADVSSFLVNHTIKRSHAILAVRQNSPELLIGLYLRVQVELADHTTAYAVGKVTGIELRNPYVGYSANPKESTNVCFRLDFNPNPEGPDADIVCESGTVFQLTSVSNSPANQAEVNRYYKTHLPLEQEERQEIHAHFQAAANFLLSQHTATAAPKPAPVPHHQSPAAAVATAQITEDDVKDAPLTPRKEGPAR